MREYLRVKIRSLADEARIIRHEEQRILADIAEAREVRHAQSRVARIDRQGVPAEKREARDYAAQVLATHYPPAVVERIRKRAERALRERPQAARAGMREHRVGVVRSEARASLIAYAFLRGRTLASAEEAPRSEPDWKKVERIVAEFGGADRGWSRQKDGGNWNIDAWRAERDGEQCSGPAASAA